MKTVNVSAAVIVRNVGENKEILLCERAHGELSNCMEYVGGKIECGENPEDAVVREVREELLVNVKVDEKIGVIEHDYDTFHLTMHMYACSIVSGDITLTEHSSSQWVLVNKLDDPSITYAPADKKATVLVMEKYCK